MEALFFDLDGPILDVSEKYYRVYSQILKESGSEPIGKEKYWDLKRSKTALPEILKLSSAGSKQHEVAISWNTLIEQKDYLICDHVWPDLWEIYDKLFKNCFTVLVTLRTHADMTEWQLKHLGIFHWFDVVISEPGHGSDQRWKSKVNAIHKSGVLEGLDRSKCLFVGDTETDILAGKELGMRTIGVSFGIRNRGILLEHETAELFDKPCELSEYLKRLT